MAIARRSRSRQLRTRSPGTGRRREKRPLCKHLTAARLLAPLTGPGGGTKLAVANRAACARKAGLGLPRIFEGDE